MRYLTRDGEQLIGNTSRQIIDALRVKSRTPCRDVLEFMDLVAVNARTQTGHPVSTRSAEAFLQDLVLAGLIERG